jgi:hypothetical protein
MQLDQWTQQEARARQRAAITDAKARAAAMTLEAERQIAEHRSILVGALSASRKVDWAQAAAPEPFDEPEATVEETKATLGVPSRSPFLEFLRIRSKTARETKEAEAAAIYEQAMGDWETSRTRHEQAAQEHVSAIKNTRTEYEAG